MNKYSFDYLFLVMVTIISQSSNAMQTTDLLRDGGGSNAVSALASDDAIVSLVLASAVTPRKKMLDDLSAVVDRGDIDALMSLLEKCKLSHEFGRIDTLVAYAAERAVGCDRAAMLEYLFDHYRYRLLYKKTYLNAAVQDKLELVLPIMQRHLRNSEIATMVRDLHAKHMVPFNRVLLSGCGIDVPDSIVAQAAPSTASLGDSSVVRADDLVDLKAIDHMLFYETIESLAALLDRCCTKDAIFKAAAECVIERAMACDKFKVIEYLVKKYYRCDWLCQYIYVVAARCCKSDHVLPILYLSLDNFEDIILGAHVQDPLLPINPLLLSRYGVSIENRGSAAAPTQQSAPPPSVEHTSTSPQSFFSKFRCVGLHRTTQRICGRLFSSQQELDDHIKRNHDSFADVEAQPILLDASARPVLCELGFKCSSCGAVYTDKSNCLKHIRPAHWGGRRVCPYCPKSYTQNAALKKHIKVCHSHRLDSE